MFQTVIERLRTPNGEGGSASDSSDEPEDNPPGWGAAPSGGSSSAMPADRPLPEQPDPPSYSNTPPPELADTAVEPPRSSEELNSEQLTVLLAAADDDAEANDILDEFGSEEGRRRVLRRVSDVQPASEPRASGSRASGARSSGRARETTRRNRATGAKSELLDLVDSDDEITPAIIESIQMNPEQTEGVTTRRGTTVGRSKKAPATRGKPLPPRRKTAKENFIDRNNRERYERAVKMSGSSNDDKPRPRRSTRRQAAKPRRKPSKMDEDEYESDGSSHHSDMSLRSSGSAGAVSASEDSDFAIEISDDEKVEESDDEDDETFSINRKRTTRAGKGRAQTRKKNAKRRDDTDDDEVEIDSHRMKGRSTGKRKRKAPKKSKDFLGRKAKSKRRRTDPDSVFDAPQDFLTAVERRERLDALVKQTAEIANNLNSAMATEKERGKADADAEVVGIGGQVVKRGTLSEEDLFAPTAEGMSMQPHQVDGVRWLLTLDAQGLNAILADEMGLGKTIQSVTFLASLLAVENRGPHIVIAPKNVVPHWGQEVERWYPGMFRVVTHIGAGQERFDRMEAELNSVMDFDILVTSFDLAMRDFFTKPQRSENGGIAWKNRQVVRAMQKLEFEYAVIDEAHRLKNSEGRFTSGLRKFTQARRRLLLTGTPLSNNLQELWGLMNVLNPRIFGSQSTFDDWFAAPFNTSDRRNALSINEQSLIVDRLHTVLRPFFRRRLRADVCPSFSSSDEVVIRCPQSSLQSSLFKHYLETRKTKQHTVNNVLMCLRQVSNHPYVASRAFFEAAFGIQPRLLVGLSGKFLFLHHALPRLITGGHRVLIFSQFRRTLDFIEDLLDHMKYKYARLDGMTTNEEREGSVEMFNKDGSDIPIFLLTTRAGGVGLNLQSADTVILFDSDWNPSADLQAVSRIQRIGQKRTVHIMRLVTHNSIDEFIVDRGQEKLRTEAVAIGAGKFNTNVDPATDSAMRQRDLERLLGEYEAKQERRSPDRDYASAHKLENSMGDETKANGSTPSVSKPNGPIALDDPKPGAPDSAPEKKSDDEKAERIAAGTNSEEKNKAGESGAVVKDEKQLLSREATETFFEKISTQLLRNGEKSLPSAIGTTLPLIKAMDEVPYWIRPGFDLLSSSLALKCQTPSGIPDAIEKAKMKNAEKSGHLPTKRKRSQRMNIARAFDNGSDSDDEFGSGSEFAQALHTESSESDAESLFMTPDVKGKKRGPKKKAPVPPSLPGSGGAVPILPANSSAAAIAGVAYLPLHGNMVPIVATGQALSRVSPTVNGTGPGASMFSNVAGRQRETVSAAGIPVVDLSSDTEEKMTPRAKAAKASPQMSPVELARARERQLHLRAVAVAEQRMRQKDAQRAAAKAKVDKDKKQVGAGAGKQGATKLTPLQMKNAAVAASKLSAAKAGASRAASSGGQAAAGGGVGSPNDKVVMAAQHVTAAAMNGTTQAGLAGPDDATVASEMARGLNPALITALQQITGVVDRGLLGDVLVQCGNDLIKATRYIFSCE